MPAPSPARTVHIKDLDFYAFDGERIVTNYCMVDVLDILRQGGVRLLPPNASTLVDDGLYPPPRASHGLPAPNSVYADPSLRVRRSELEALLLRAIHADLVQQDRRARDWAADAPWYGPGGVGPQSLTIMIGAVRTFPRNLRTFRRRSYSATSVLTAVGWTHTRYWEVGRPACLGPAYTEFRNNTVFGYGFTEGEAFYYLHIDYSCILTMSLPVSVYSIQTEPWLGRVFKVKQTSWHGHFFPPRPLLTAHQAPGHPWPAILYGCIHDGTTTPT